MILDLKFVPICIIVLAGLLILGNSGTVNFSSYGDPTDASKQISPKVLQFVTNSKEGSGSTLFIPIDEIIFKILPKYDENGRITSLSLAKDTRFDYLYRQVGFAEKSQTTVFCLSYFYSGSVFTKWFL